MLNPWLNLKLILSVILAFAFFGINHLVDAQLVYSWTARNNGNYIIKEEPSSLRITGKPVNCSKKFGGWSLTLKCGSGLDITVKSEDSKDKIADYVIPFPANYFRSVEKDCKVHMNLTNCEDGLDGSLPIDIVSNHDGGGKIPGAAIV